MKATPKKVTFVTLLLLFALTGCKIKWPMNNSNEKLRKVATEFPIGANEEIVIGEFEDRSYRVLVDNQSEETIYCKIVDIKTDEINENLTLPKGEDVTLHAANFQKMVIQNPSKSPITIKLGMDREIMGLRYQYVKEYKQP